MNEKLRWGILSTANIGLNRVIPALQSGAYSTVTAIASRSREKAAAAARKFSISKAYDSYDDLLSDTEVDAIYNPLPNHLHVPWSIKAMQAGKHVLCEKPIALTSAEAQQLFDAAQRHPHLKVMEAFMYRFHPQWEITKKMIKDGKIGQVQTIHSFFSYHKTDPDNIRNFPEMGGGGLMDIGCYSISLSRLIFGEEPQRVSAVMEYDPQFKVDRLASVILDFGGRSATFTCATQLAPYQRANIFGDKGSIKIEMPFSPAPDKPARIIWQHEDKKEIILTESADQYKIQGEKFSLAALKNTDVPIPLNDAVANMRVLEATRLSAEKGFWTQI